MSDVRDMRAIVLAAGLGTRMRPLTDTCPKAMVSVGGKCLIDHVLDWMGEAGLSDVVVNTHYLAEILEAHLSARSRPRIILSHEEVLLETGGGIAKALALLGTQPFFAANSDTICLNGKTHALQRLHDAWDDEEMDALLLLHPVADAVGYDGGGDFHLHADGTLLRKRAGESAPYVFTGIQMLNPRLFIAAPQGAFSMNLLYNRGMREDGSLLRIKAIVHDGQWLHVGDPAAVLLAEQYL